MKLELSLGIGLGFSVFLVYLGFDITPLIILGILAIMFYLMLQRKGFVKTESFQEIERTQDFNFENIGGQDVAKQELKEALEFLIRSMDITKRGIRPLKGILLTGPPGT